jgi:hypothetical protein
LCDEIQTSGYLQPMLLNRAALSQMHDSIMNNGLTGICIGFKCSADIGLGVLAWQNQLYKIDLPFSHDFNTYRPNMYDIWNYFQVNGSDIDFASQGRLWNESVINKLVPNIYPLAGYELTKHYQDYIVSKVWKAFTRDDCIVKGTD